MRIVVFGLLALGCGVSEGGLFGTEGDAGSGGAAPDAGNATGGVAFHPGGSVGAGGRSSSGGASSIGGVGGQDPAACTGQPKFGECFTLIDNEVDCLLRCGGANGGVCAVEACADGVTAEFYEDGASCEKADSTKRVFTLKGRECTATSSVFRQYVGSFRCCCRAC